MTEATRRRLSPAERRSELLTFGQLFFAEHAVDAMSVDAIAERAGVSKGLLYNYFGGRRGFYVATVEAIAEEVRALTVPEPDMPFVEAFRRALERYVGWVKSNGGSYRVLVSAGLGVDAEVGAVVEGLRRETMSRVAERAGLRRSALVDVALYGWVCFAENACLEWLGRPSVSRAALVDVLIGALVGAVGAAGGRLDA